MYMIIIQSISQSIALKFDEDSGSGFSNEELTVYTLNKDETHPLQDGCHYSGIIHIQTGVDLHFHDLMVFGEF